MKTFTAICATAVAMASTSAAAMTMSTTPAHAASCSYTTGSYTWTVERGTTTSIGTNAMSDWVEARQRDASVTRVETSTGTASMTVSASVGSEAGALLAKYKAEFGVALTTSISGTQGYSYTLTVPKGYQGRAHLYQESRTFVAKRWYHPYPCGSALVQTVSVTAPRGVPSMVWKLDTRKI